jgi:hypothetical protein
MRSAGWDTPGLDGVKIALGQLRSAHGQATRFTFRHAPVRRARARGVIRPFIPTQGYDNTQDDIAEALDHIARAISAIDHNLQDLITKLDSDSAVVARIAASLKAESR